MVNLGALRGFFTCSSFVTLLNESKKNKSHFLGDLHVSYIRVCCFVCNLPGMPKAKKEKKLFNQH